MIFDFNKYQNNIAIITDSKDIFTYGNLHDMQAKLFRYIGARKLIVVLCDNKIGALIGYVCFLNNHIVPIMIDKRLDINLMKNLLKIYKPNYLWVPEDNSDFSSYKVKCVLYGYKLIEYIKQNDIAMYAKLALLLTTSGTTGSPKLVRISYENIISNTNAIISYLQIDENERAITVLPMNYTYGLSIINTHLFAGACIMLTDKKVYDKEFWSFFNEFKATSLSGVPYTYDLLRKINFKIFKVPSLKMMTQAGGKMSNDTCKYFYNYAVNTNRVFYIMYGQTEATARMSYLPFEYMSQKQGSIGIPIEDATIELRDKNGNIIQEKNKIGEIIYRGKNVSLGYALNRRDLEKGDVKRGVLQTGDFAYFDADNFLFICGRKDRYIKIQGNRIDLDDFEIMLSRKYQGEILCLFKEEKIHIITEELIVVGNIMKYASKITGVNINCFIFNILPSIPRQSNGKTDYCKIQNLI